MVSFKKQTYSEQVAEYIKGCILSGKLAPGDQVKEAQIAEELSISRAPVREALQILAQEGLVQIEHQKRKRIAALTPKQIKNSYFTGGTLEAAAVADALPLYTDEDFEHLTQVLEKMRLIANKTLPVEMMSELDNEFHGVLFARVDNDLLKDLCKRSCQGISKYLLFRHWLDLYSPQDMFNRHKVIIDALLTKDPAEVERVIRKHYLDSGEWMARYGIRDYDDEKDKT